MRFTILTLFPEYFQSSLTSSILGRAREAELFSVDFINLREFGEGKYRAVDDKPYGGGAGMVMMAPVLERALSSLLGGDAAVAALESDVREFRAPGSVSSAGAHPHVVYLSPQGRNLDAGHARKLSQHSHLVLICGHYEGIDERAIEAFVHEEVSIGDFILTGGEPAAAVLLDAVARFIPGVVGEAQSVENDTFESPVDMAPGGLKYPVFTRPSQWRGRSVPDVLLSGHHGLIETWRRQQSEKRTMERRPDLLKNNQKQGARRN